MKTLHALRRLWRAPESNEHGATAVEYGIMVALIAAVIISPVTLLGGQVEAAFTTVSSVVSGPPFVPVSGVNILQSGQTMATGQQLTSLNGNYALMLYANGEMARVNLLTTGREVISFWGSDGSLLIMQADGYAYVSERGTSGRNWFSPTDGHPGAYLELGDDGNLRTIDVDGVTVLHISQ